MSVTDTLESTGARAEPVLFDGLAVTESAGTGLSALGPTAARKAVGAVTDDFAPSIDERLLDVYARADDPSDPFELRDLYLGRVEHELGASSHRPELAKRWASARPLRSVDVADVLRSRATVRCVKELFNWFFRDDLYGDLRADHHVILSSGSADEQTFGIPSVLKECVHYALARDWYGYSDSRGRGPAREAVAAYESARSACSVDESSVALTLGGTFAISALVDFLALERPATEAALCAIPNYPPLVQAVARRMDVSLVPVSSRGGTTSLEPLIDALTPTTPLVLLQTVMNPSGALVDETQLEQLIAMSSPSTTILLDECHECLGPLTRVSTARLAPNVVRVSSISKTWSAPGLKLGWILADEAFIREYYEYASTTFGGPPSFFYTLVEVMARMERWLIEGVDLPGRAEVAEFESSYGLTSDRLGRAYASYRADRLARETALLHLRENAIDGIAGPHATVVRPRYSINMAVDFAGAADSYLCFRRVLAETGVAVFPGILTFCLGGGTVRVTTARAWEDLERAIEALERRGGA